MLRRYRRYFQKYFFHGNLKPLLFFGAVALLLGLVGFGHLHSNSINYPEVAQVSQKSSWTFDDVSNYFTDLANRKGAAYAYDVLKQVSLPSGIDLHLLGHVVGDVLYKQQGANGIKICTQDFRNACSHSIVTGLFQDKGEAALPQIAASCRQAPGGSGAYTMCFHGLGHGILAFYGYDMAKAATTCSKLGTPQFNNREGIECIGGTVMEIISGGGHDHDAWVRQNKFYLQSDHPLDLCQNSFIPSSAKEICYTYITPYLFIVGGGDLGNPGSFDFKKSFSFCDSLPSSDSNDRRACFGGFGKEFIVLAQGRDIRRIDQLNPTQLQQVYEWCKLAGQDPAISDCIGSAVTSIYWGGENDYRAAVNLCRLTDNPQKSRCFSSLTDTVFYYSRDPGYRQRFCSSLPESYGSACLGKLSGA